MIVPQYWAEARTRHRDRNRQVTVRRFGWSDVRYARELHDELSGAKSGLPIA